jgi:hypothetical protein
MQMTSHPEVARSLGLRSSGHGLCCKVPPGLDLIGERRARRGNDFPTHRVAPPPESCSAAIERHPDDSVNRRPLGRGEAHLGRSVPGEGGSGRCRVEVEP